MNVTLTNRADTRELALDNLDVSIERYSHAAYGGPKLARLRFAGDDNDLWQLIENVRCPLRIYADEGDCVWWGMAGDIEATVKESGPSNTRVRVGVSLDTMYNRVAIAYNKVNPNTGMQERATTTWAIDLLSAAEYGIRELIWSSASATKVHAEAARDTKLAQVKYPQAIIVPEDQNTSGAVITARGWWDSMNWRYYANSGTASVDTATQCGTILANKGQFFNSVFVNVSSGISIRETRDGDASAMYEVMEMLKTGTTNYRRMLVEVDQYRNARIYEEPAVPGDVYGLLAAGGAVDKFGAELRRSAAPAELVGEWAKWIDVIPTSISTILLAEPGLVLVEECEYDVKKDKLIITPRGDLDPWNFPKVKDG